MTLSNQAATSVQPSPGARSTVQRITPFLWFDGQAEDAASLYTSLFENSGVTGITRYNRPGAEVSGRPEGSVMTVAFQLAGQSFTALNGGPEFKFTPAISLAVQCADQAEVDRLWEKLTDGGEPLPCGWLTDRFGVSWQIVPAVLMEMLNDPDEAKAEAVMKAMLQMQKIDTRALQEAYEQA